MVGSTLCAVSLRPGIPRHFLVLSIFSCLACPALTLRDSNEHKVSLGVDTSGKALRLSHGGSEATQSDSESQREEALQEQAKDKENHQQDEQPSSVDNYQNQVAEEQNQLKESEELLEEEKQQLKESQEHFLAQATDDDNDQQVEEQNSSDDDQKQVAEEQQQLKESEELLDEKQQQLKESESLLEEKQQHDDNDQQVEEQNSSDDDQNQVAEEQQQLTESGSFLEEKQQHDDNDQQDEQQNMVDDDQNRVAEEQQQLKESEKFVDEEQQQLKESEILLKEAEEILEEEQKLKEEEELETASDAWDLSSEELKKLREADADNKVATKPASQEKSEEEKNEDKQTNQEEQVADDKQESHLKEASAGQKDPKEASAGEKENVVAAKPASQEKSEEEKNEDKQTNQEEQAAEDKQTNQEENDKSKKLDHGMDPEERAALIKSMSNATSEPAWAWFYNPFRTFSSFRSTLKDDRECPDPSLFEYFAKSHTKGELAMCVLRWNMLKFCNIPDDKDICTVCEASTLNTTTAEQLEDCNTKLPLIFLKVYMLYPVIVLAMMCLLSPLLTRVFDRLLQRKQVETFVLDYIGTPNAAPKRIGFRVYLLVLQIGASALNVFLYCVLNLYESMAPPWVATGTGELTPSWNGWLQLFMNVQMTINYLVMWMKSGFSMDSLLSANAIIDVLTVGQTLSRQLMYSPIEIAPGFQADPEKDWFVVARPTMNVHFLRSYRCLSALLEIQAMGALQGISAVQQQLMKSGLRLWALVTICTGAMILLEWIGHDLNLNNETPGMRNLGECGIEEGLAGNIACIPFIVGIYWVFTTISTVGYGDFGPHSALTYALVIVIIVAGVTFFSVESQTLMDVIAMENWGLGAAQVRGAHVVLTGGAMRDVDTQVIYPFMQQILHRSVIELGGKWPEVVLLGQVEDPDLVNDFIDSQLTPAMKKNVKFCNGDPLTPAGVEQAKVEQAYIVYILPSSTTSSMDREDEYNTHVALSVKSLSRTAFRLVLFRSISLKFAMTSGIHPGQVLCLNHFRTSVLLQSSRVRGWQLFLLLMMTNTNWYREGAKEYCRNALLPDEYVDTLANSVFGFGLSKYAAGKPFAELAGYIYRETGAIAFSVQLEGRVVSFPFHEVVNPNSVIFCIHKRDPRLAKKGDQIVAPIDWQSHFEMQRNKHTPKLIGTEDLGRELQYLLTGLEPDTEDVVNEQEMKVMLEKANLMRAKKVEFMLLVMTRGGETIWPMLYLYLKKYAVSFGDGNDLTKVASGLIILCAEPPPRSMVEVVDALNPEVDISFIVGSWQFPDALRDAGAEECKVLLCFPIKAELTTDPESDSRIFFMLRLLGQLNLRPECLVLYELSSGVAGAHVLPSLGKTEQASQEVTQTAISFQDEGFYPACAGGQIFVPRTLLGMMAKSYYTFGILEAVQSLIQDAANLDAVRPEQICLPKALEGGTFGDCFYAMIEGRIGPSPTLVLGMLRETLYSECALLNPSPDMQMQSTDLLVILCTGHWIMWAQEQGLRCIGGRERRIDQVDLVTSFRAVASTRSAPADDASFRPAANFAGKDDEDPAAAAAKQDDDAEL